MIPCADCHGRIKPGEATIQTEDGPVHADCWGIEPAEPRRGAVCDTCFMEKSLSGECGCS